MEVRDRAWWGASAPRQGLMRLPVGEAWLHHSVTQLTDDPRADMKAIERVGVQRFGIFSYSWAYHRPSRLLLEGAGDTIGAHTAGRNSTSLGLVLIGNYDQQPLDDVGVADLHDAFAWLIAGNRLRPGVYPTGGHRDLKQTACPGGNAYARIGDIRNREDDMYGQAERDELIGRIDEMRSKLGDLAAIKNYVVSIQQTVSGDQVDEGEIARQVLAGLDPDAIAAAIPDGLARQVADELHKRLAG